MKKLLVNTIISSMLVTSAMATNLAIKIGAGSTNIDGGDSATTTDIQLAFNYSTISPKLYTSFLFGYTMGKINDKKLDSGNIQYNFGYIIKKKYTPYIFFGLNTANDIYIDGSYYYGAGFKYNIYKKFGVEIEYKQFKSASDVDNEPDSSNVSAYLSYGF